MVFYTGHPWVGGQKTDPLIDLYATIEGSKSVFEEFGSASWGDVYTPRSNLAALKRIEELGLKQINETLGHDVSHYPSARLVESSFKHIEDALWHAAPNVKTRKIRYKDKDFVNAINYLELFSIYAAQKKALEHKTDGFKQSDLTRSKVENNVFKAIKELEFLATHPRSDKSVIRQHVLRASHLLNKIYTKDLTHMEQVATGKTFNKAIRILEKMAK